MTNPKLSTTQQIALDRKASALDLFAKLGFVDCEDDEVLGNIFHPATGIILNAAAIYPGDVIPEIVRQSERRGVAYAQDEMRKALGL